MYVSMTTQWDGLNQQSATFTYIMFTYQMVHFFAPPHTMFVGTSHHILEDPMQLLNYSNKSQKSTWRKVWTTWDSTDLCFYSQTSAYIATSHTHTPINHHFSDAVYCKLTLLVRLMSMTDHGQSQASPPDSEVFGCLYSASCSSLCSGTSDDHLCSKLHAKTKHIQVMLTRPYR